MTGTVFLTSYMVSMQLILEWVDPLSFFFFLPSMTNALVGVYPASKYRPGHVLVCLFLLREKSSSSTSRAEAVDVYKHFIV